MGHHHHHHADSSSSNLGIAFLLNVCFTIIELIGGLYTNSLAILSDAIHDLGDSLSLGLAYYFQKISNKPSDQKYTYGYKRFSVIGAVVNSIVLVIGSIFIIINAVPRLMHPETTDSNGMIGLAILGIVFNGLAYHKTHQGHSHNERVVSLHLLEDVLGWCAVLIGAIIIKFTGWYIIDPILSIGITLYILINVIKSIRHTMKIILQATPDNIDIESLSLKMKQISGVSDVHDVHVWTIDGLKNILTAHVVVTEDLSIQDCSILKKSIHAEMHDANIEHCTLEIEYGLHDCNLHH